MSNDERRRLWSEVLSDQMEAALIRMQDNGGGGPVTTSRDLAGWVFPSTAYSLQDRRLLTIARVGARSPKYQARLTIKGRTKAAEARKREPDNVLPFRRRSRRT
jgi:hypothetical protein